MSSADNNTKYIFRNLLVISLDLFKALEYFAKRDLVHRDVKRMELCLHDIAIYIPMNDYLIGSNILLKMQCGCLSAIACTCYGIDGRGRGTALLSDFDLVENTTSDDSWARLGNREPAGTRGMKAPEVN